MEMSNAQENLTDKEIEDLQSIVTDTLASICAVADKHNIDRDSMLKYFADMLTAFAEVSSIDNYETNHTNADRIKNMSDEELAQFLCKVKSDYQWMEHEFPSEEEHGEWEEWLQSEAEQKIKEMESD